MLIIDEFSSHSLGPSPCWESELPLVCQAALLRKQRRNVETKNYAGKNWKFRVFIQTSFTVCLAGFSYKLWEIMVLVLLFVISF